MAEVTEAVGRLRALMGSPWMSGFDQAKVDVEVIASALEDAQALATAASCYVQCSDLAVGDDRKSCQSQLSAATMRVQGRS